MMKILVVDDEYLIRQRIINLVCWNEYGMEVAGEAEDGEQALDIIPEIRPQIIIVDINMPIMDGLELSRIVKQRYPEIKIIILSGYSEFDYAKQAIDAGVLNYIIKPIDAEEFRNVLIESKNIVIREEQEKKYVRQLEQELRLEKIQKKEQFLRDLVSGSLPSSADIRKELENYGVRAFERGFCVVLKIDSLQKKFPESSDKNTWVFALYNITGEILKKYRNSVVFRDEDYRVGVLYESSSTGGKDASVELCTLLQEIQSVVNEYFDFTVTAGIGSIYEGIPLIRTSYSRAVSALGRKFHSGGDSVYSWADSPHDDCSKEIPLCTGHEELLRSFRSGSITDVLRIAGDLFREMKTKKTSRDIAVVSSVQFLSLLLPVFEERGTGSTHDTWNAECWITEFQVCETLEEIEKTVERFLQSAISLMMTAHTTRTSLITEKAKRYIRQHFSKAGLTLEEIACNVYVSPSYLSSVFKKEQRQSVIEYLTRVRMEEAKKLMDAAETVQISLLAGAVGYHDPFYFSKCFKKSFGISPTAYMETKSQY